VARAAPRWTFLTNHGRLLLCIAREPGLSLREIGDRVGITERAAHRIVAELDESGYLTRRRNGRRNRYTIAPDLPVPDSIARERQIGDLLDVLADQAPAKRRPGP
jgi:DNA-binding IclR family transcriptional regulator